MDEDHFVFSDVTLLITHYNRSRSLERLLNAFRSLHIVFEDIVVSDDGSKPETIDQLKKLQNLFNFRLITTPVNKGLGNNINKGQDAVTTAYTLYVQEDFEPKAVFAGHLRDALQFMEVDKELDLARFYAYFTYPYLKPYGRGFSEMIFKPFPWANNHLKFYVYSDHPHLRRSSFFQKFGRYPEGIKGDLTEYQMAISFIQKKGKGIFYDNFTDLFYQKNSPDEPSTMGRSSWRESKNIFALAARAAYLQFKLLKCTGDVFFKRY
ncbi:glycosyltransferase [Mucilaginibacter sp. UR6-11]|uniref:glycosyltransferase n=1 Tax=Mucilaginibacter sp. UR6-11 TaxID=1435644 RepID=UPI001E3D965F|nr:glycosyltransferase [Mucilaginibacter sp. UR6-11]MCC8423765.1 glycosyltransferase [Mucilaginibacter sp. UR6-11]